MLIGLLAGLGWTLLTPPFQVPDETAHFAYVQYLAETGKRPGGSPASEISTEQIAVMGAIRTTTIIGRPLESPPATRAADQAADQQIEAARRHLPRDDGGGPSTASGQPPLYYLVAAVPYRLTSWASLPTRLAAVRLLGALFLALTAGLARLLVLEFLPGRSWAGARRRVRGRAAAGDGLHLRRGDAGWPVDAGGDRSAVHGGADLAARADPAACRLTFGAFVGAGMLTKLTFVAFVPPAILFGLVVVWRDRALFAPTGPDGRARSAWTGVLGVAARIAAPMLGLRSCCRFLYFVWSKAQGLPLRAPGSATARPPVELRRLRSSARSCPTRGSCSCLARGSRYAQFPYPPFTETWLTGLIGRYGWLDYTAPQWMIDWGLNLVRAGFVLIAVGLVRLRHQWRQVLPIALLLGAFVASLLLVIGHAGYGYRNATGLVFEQARYVFPIVGVYALGVALVCWACGRRFAPVVAGLLVALFAVHELSGMMLTLARYQG